MDAAELATLRSALRDRRDALLNSIGEAAAQLAEIRAERADTPADDEHDPEGSTMSTEWSRAEGIHSDAQRELDELDRAEQRMTDGTYGICAVCGKDIPVARLELRPAATLCVSCANRQH